MPLSFQEDFDTSAITPTLIRRVLKSCDKSSSPGDDRISYHHLWNLPSTHSFLAELFSRIVKDSHQSPEPWCEGKIILVSKGGDPKLPSSFRPIALTSATGKVFHKILARRLERYCLANGFINPNIQKGFLRGVSGATEHISTVNGILHQARLLKLPVNITFLDIQNAFGSTPHSLIHDMLALVKVPPSISKYIADCYSKLKARIHTKNWDTSTFPIDQGVFQGDTMSPIIFLLAISPILHLATNWAFQGFRSKIPVANSDSLPPRDAHVYILWDEPNSDEPRGWYHSTITDYLPDGRAVLAYPDGQTECLDLNTVQWFLARKNAKCYIEPGTKLPKPLKDHPAQPKYANGTEHKVKAFADDLTIINSNKVDHQKALLRINSACSDLGLSLKPPKCVSLSIENGTVSPKANFSLTNGTTRSLSEAPTKFLGHTIAASEALTKRAASSSLKSIITEGLQKIDDRPIRGEMKVWILRHYLIPSTHFHLMVNLIQPSTIATLENTIARFVKKWLQLPRNATRAVIHHPTVTNVPSLGAVMMKAKLSLLVSLHYSSDPAIIEMNNILNEPAFLQGFMVSKALRERFQMLDLQQPKKALKTAVKQLVIEERKNKWNNNLESLQVQRKFIDIINLEDDTKLWNRIVDGLPKGQLSFLLRAGSDTLPTPTNLHRWKFRVSQVCPLCRQPSPCTTAHILSGCPTALLDGRFTWRHDSVLNQLQNNLLLHLDCSWAIFINIPGLRASDAPPSTIPPNVVVTPYRPDLVAVKGQTLHLVELTVCGNTPSAMAAAHNRKANKLEYLHLLSDIRRKGWIASYSTIEIGALGHYNPDSLSTLSASWQDIRMSEWRKILTSGATTAISCSQVIFHSRANSAWSPNRPLL